MWRNSIFYGFPMHLFFSFSSILTAFLSLAGAAWVLDLTYLICLNLFSPFCWFFIYFFLFIDLKWEVLERTKQFVKKRWLFRKKKGLFLQEGFLCFTFLLFLFIYKLLFPEMEKDNLVNPLQVVAQLCCFLFFFKYEKKPERVKHLLLLSFSFSITSTLYFLGIDLKIISLVFVLFFLVISFFPFDFAFFFILVSYSFSLDQGLARWGFYLAFQQGAYFCLALFLEKESSSTSKKRGLSFLFLLFFQLLFGFYYFEKLFFIEYLKLATLVSGACIVFLSLERRTLWSFRIPFLIYFFISIFIAVKMGSSNKTTLFQIPDGVFIFIFIHVWSFVFFFVFRGILPRRMQPLVPLFFSGILFSLGYFPQLSWLEKWIEGMDLLLLTLGFVSFFEEKGNKIKKK